MHVRSTSDCALCQYYNSFLRNTTQSVLCYKEAIWCLTSSFRLLQQDLFSIQELGDRLCGLVVRVLGYRSGCPGSIPGTTKKKVVGLERDPLSLVSATEELFDRKVATPV
jgi:hypothetical protein